jgi:hypothetical protein
MHVLHCKRAAKHVKQKRLVLERSRTVQDFHDCRHFWKDLTNQDQPSRWSISSKLEFVAHLGGLFAWKPEADFEPLEPVEPTALCVNDALEAGLSSALPKLEKALVETKLHMDLFASVCQKT